MAFEMKRNDRRPYFRVQLLANSTPVDLTLAVTAVFTLKAGATTKVNKGTMTFIDRPTGVVEYPWAAGDTDTSNTYNAEVEVDWGGELQSFPSTGYFTVTISDDLA